jgi:ZIP family zinc transporter
VPRFTRLWVTSVLLAQGVPLGALLNLSPEPSGWQPFVTEILKVVGIGLVAAILTSLGAPLAEARTLSSPVVSGALQLAAGLLTGIVLIELLPEPFMTLPAVTVAVAFCLGAAGFVLFDYFSAWKAARQHDQDDPRAASVSLYVGIMADVFIDGVIIGIAASVDKSAAVPLAVGIGAGQAPLTFVANAAAKRQGTPLGTRRRLLLMYTAAILVGAVLGYLVLQGQPEAVKFTLLAAAGGLLLAAVTQVMIPEAIEALHDEPPSLTGLMYVVGVALFLVLKSVLG